MTTDGTSGISVERLDWNNYPAWAANMKFFLTTKKCWHMVIHTEPAANAEDRKADELALSYIGLCVKPVHQPTILRCTTSNQAWTTLQETFAAKTFARKLQLRRDLNSLKMATNETVTAFTSRAKALQDQLTAAGHRVDDIDVACQVLAGLPSSFDTVVTVIETTTASTGTFTVDEILPHLLQAEQRRSKTDFNRSPDSALMATFQPRRDDRQFNHNGGNLYFITLLDDHTGYSLISPLRRKSDAAAFLKTAITMLERQTGYTVKRIRSDNGGEFINTELDTFYQSKGIKSETSVPYTPQQNGKAERLNRTLLDKARPMLADANLPKFLWAEAIVTANYLRNRSPISSQDTTSYELFHGTKPDLSHLRTFGARAYAHVPTVLRTKLDAVSEPGRFIGYPANTKGYKILLDNGTTVISRDVTFDETSSILPKTNLPKTNLPKTNLPETIPFSDTDDNEAVGAPAEPEAPPSPPIALRRTERAAARRPASLWQDDAYRITDRTTAIVNIATTAAEPTSLEEALQSPEADQWRLAMDEEIASLAANDTWTLQPAPPSVKPIPVKWVYKEKRDANGNIERHKARLVVKGFHQREGIDYDEVFAPVSKYSTLRTVLAIAADLDLEIHQLDIKTAFLNGKLDEDVYIQQPPGYNYDNPDLACKLNKALYGLKQASRAWHRTLKTEIESMGFKESTADPGLFIKPSSPPAYLLIYVDDILVITNNTSMLNSVKNQISTAFETRDLGPATFFLGIDIIRDRTTKTIKLTQTRHTTDLLSKFNMEKSKPFDTPSSIAIKLTADGEPLDTKEHPYSTLIGSLMYLASCTRPDIAQAVGALARYMSKPTTTHWTAAKHVLRYLAGTTDYGIIFTPSDSTLNAYCDANHAGDIDTRRSTTGYVFTTFNNGAITWSSRLQPTVAASTTEAEYMAAASTVKEALWLRKLFTDLDLHIACIDIKSDSQSAIHMLKNPVISLRSKHIDIVHHFARERVARGEVNFFYIPTDSMVADILTKRLVAITQYSLT